MDSDYYLQFENKFRGERKKVFDIFSCYEPLIDIAIQDQISTILLDIGCLLRYVIGGSNDSIWETLMSDVFDIFIMIFLIFFFQFLFYEISGRKMLAFFR